MLVHLVFLNAISSIAKRKCEANFIEVNLIYIYIYHTISLFTCASTSTDCSYGVSSTEPSSNLDGAGYQSFEESILKKLQKVCEFKNSLRKFFFFQNPTFVSPYLF